MRGIDAALRMGFAASLSRSDTGLRMSGGPSWNRHASLSNPLMIATDAAIRRSAGQWGELERPFRQAGQRVNREELTQPCGWALGQT